jgi:hypothetical protein
MCNYHTVGTIPKSNIKIVERGQKNKIKYHTFGTIPGLNIKIIERGHKKRNTTHSEQFKD